MSRASIPNSGWTQSQCFPGPGLRVAGRHLHLTLRKQAQAALAPSFLASQQADSAGISLIFSNSLPSPCSLMVDPVNSRKNICAFPSSLLSLISLFCF